MKLRLRVHKKDDTTIEVWKDDCIWCLLHPDIFENEKFYSRLVEEGKDIVVELKEAACFACERNVEEEDGD